MSGTPPPIPDLSKPAAAPPPPPPAQPSGWSPAQLARLESEWARLRREFAFHPVVRVTPTAGDPPGEYRVDFTLRTLLLDGAGQLAYVDACGVQVSLPADFPHVGPVVRATCSVFHPNVDADGVLFVTPAWDPAAGSLVDLVTRCGQLLAWQVYDPQAVANEDALAWASVYPQHIPTDPNAVPTPDAGGRPIERIARDGPGSLDQVRTQLTEMSHGILEARAGTDRTEVRGFGRRTSQALDAFADADVPADLRSHAAELAAWAQSMTSSRSVWDELRSLCAHARTASDGVRVVRESLAKLGDAVRTVESLVQTDPVPNEPLETIARLPAVSALDPAAIRLRGAARDVEHRTAALRVALEGLCGAPPAPVGTPGTPLHERTAADVARATAEAAAAREAGFAVIAGAEPLLARARVELAALDGLVAWAQFTDLVRRGNEMTQRLVELVAAGIQAYHIVTPAGRFGPYPFEQRVDLVTALLVVRRIGAGPVEVYDARSMALLGKGPGVATVKIPDAEGTLREAEVRATEHTDELRVQLEYLIKTSREQVALLGKSAGSAAPSWTGRFVAALANFESTHAATDVHRRASHRWKALLADLDELAQFKERAATCALLDRHAEFVPAVLALRAKSQAALAEANERLAFIASRSTRDADTGVVVVAPQFAVEHVQRLAQHDRAERDLAKVHKLLKHVAAEVQTRLAHERLRGRAGLPGLKLLNLANESYVGMVEHLSDDHVRLRVAELQQVLGVRLA